MPEGTAVLDRPSVGAPPRDITPLDIPPRDLPTEPRMQPVVESNIPSIADISDEPNHVPDQPRHDTEELRRRVLESMGIGSQSFDESHSPPMEAEMHSEKKKGIMSKISEFFKGGSKLSKIAKLSAIPFALIAMILMKGLKGSKRE